MISDWSKATYEKCKQKTQGNIEMNCIKMIDLKAKDYHKVSLMSLFSDKTVAQQKQYT